MEPASSYRVLGVTAGLQVHGSLQLLGKLPRFLV